MCTREHIAYPVRAGVPSLLASESWPEGDVPPPPPPPSPAASTGMGSGLKALPNHWTLRPTRHLGSLEHRTGVKNHTRRLDEFLAEVGPSARVLDLGSGARQLGPNVVSFDIGEFPGVEVRGDAHHLPFQDAAFDAVVVQQVIEHVSEPARVLAEARRVLRPGGLAFISAPFVEPVHEPYDFYRWTRMGLEHLVSKTFEVVSVEPYGGKFSAFSWILNTLVASTLKDNIRVRALSFSGVVLSRALTAWLKYVDEAVATPVRSDLAQGFLVIGRAREES